ncbi:M23 family metallopeptidase [Lujinxingia vulgaris]|uniref:M23 family metallopeptidase n=1 Tax=Lujinxingia vulgaris TaxID=2600176 RepID=A0A5C6X6P7_9DELT|nr:peptidoglycan DD-metalloendopeptidase family protein [Lujinxingia vulgaris]TXD35929.1 M23 family metallopeptidase [Lujinxingia vulgaris]
MRGRWPKQDMLLHPRRRRRRGRPWLTALLVLLAVGALVYMVVGGEEEPDEQALAHGLAFAEAYMRVNSAVALSQATLTSGEAEAILAEKAEEAALSASFTEGQAAVIAGEIKPNQSVFVSLQARNVSAGAIHEVVTATEKEFDFRRSRPGDQWRVETDESGKIVEFRYQTSPEDIWVTTLQDDGTYVAVKQEVPIETRHEAVAGSIASSFWLALEATGESGALAHRFMEIFQYTIDFNTETRAGDHFAMIFEKVYLEGEFLRYGRVIGAKYMGERGTYWAFYDEERGEEPGYYDEEGESLQRQFLRSPLPFTRVTSRYGRRVHPVLGGTRMHRGVDYGAPIGTPVQAVADGTVVFAGRAGGYGNLIKIRHSGGFETRFAHLNNFARGIRAGVRVTRGQLVAKSGNTGRSTGPHLHYEMLQNGRHIDPLSVDTARGEPLKGESLASFKSEIVVPWRAKLTEALREAAPRALAQREAASGPDEQLDTIQSEP